MCAISPLNISFAAHHVCVSTAKRECIVAEMPSERTGISTKSTAVHQPPGMGLELPRLSRLPADTE